MTLTEAERRHAARIASYRQPSRMNTDNFPDVVRDGEVVRVPMMMMDAAQRAVAGLVQQDASAIVDAEAIEADRERSRAGWMQRTADAWKHGRVLDAAPTMPIIADDNGQAAYEARIRDAWRTPA